MSGPFLFLLLAIVWTIVVLVIFIDWHEAERLNLTLEGCHMAKIGDSIVARIAPTNAAGAQAPVFSVEWSEIGDSYDITPSPDGLTATLVARVAGSINSVFVSATTKSGAVLTAAADLPDVDEVPVDEEAVTLNLSVG